MKTTEQKRFDAEARQVEYAALTLDEKLARARSRRGESAREVARLLAAVKS